MKGFQHIYGMQAKREKPKDILEGLVPTQKKEYDPELVENAIRLAKKSSQRGAAKALGVSESTIKLILEIFAPESVNVSKMIRDRRSKILELIKEKPRKIKDLVDLTGVSESRLRYELLVLTKRHNITCYVKNKGNNGIRYGTGGIYVYEG